jgi:hypothetical protein
MKSISQFTNEFNKDDLVSKVMLVRRVGKFCGRNGYVWQGDEWHEYRGLRFTGKTLDAAPVLSRAVFLKIVFSEEIDTQSLIDIVGSARGQQRFKRTLSGADILNKVGTSDALQCLSDKTGHTTLISLAR